MIKIIVCSFLMGSVVWAAAPDDIAKSSQRAWYDGVDIDADGSYTDNPGSGSSMGLWRDKSGNSNDISSSGSHRPVYRIDDPATQRNGVDFDGSDDYLKDNNDIWNGSVNHSDIFIVSKVDNYTYSFLFSSMVTHDHRLSVHLPWGGTWSAGTSYYDHGQCCGSPARLYGSITINTWNHYFWHFVGDGSLSQVILQDGSTKLSDTNGIDTYNSTGGSFSLAARTYDGRNNYSGKIYEAIFYQTNLNTAQRRILSAYLSAKWQKAFASSATYADVYSGDGDTSGNGDYDFFVGGIGRESDGTQIIGTSQGLTITDNNFLTSDGKYVVAGVDYLTDMPTTGTESAGWLGDNATTDSYEYRASRLWYIDNTGVGGTVNLSFNAAEIGVPINNGATYGLLCREGSWGSFHEMTTSVMGSGIVAFQVLPTDDVCTIGKKKTIAMISKSSCVIDDPVNNISNPKRIPGATIRYALEVENSSSQAITNVIATDEVNSTFFNTATITNHRIGTGNCNCSNPGGTSANGSNGTANGVNPVKLDFGTVNANSTECGYFEVDIE